LLKLASYPHPDVQSWALWNLNSNGYTGLSNLLAEKYFSSPYMNTRMTALKLLAQLKDDNFVRVTAAALNDSYELIRRFAATYCQKSGDPRLAPALIRLVTHPNISKRVNYQAMDALAYFDSTLLIQELDKRLRGLIRQITLAPSIGRLHQTSVKERDIRVRLLRPSQGQMPLRKTDSLKSGHCAT
ncbi:MAG TPA: HEAT repeat domain-containing protein, partial [Bacteroidales bacterium]|nr:HEAT repeat domain-containing protein [Bacteroidales bacterium]